MPLVVLACGLIALFGTAASAQSLDGKITDAASGRPIAGARVSIVRDGRSAVAGQDGAYRLRVSAGTHIVSVSAIGYAAIVDSIVVGTSDLVRAFALERSGQQLDPSVVTGTRASGRTVLSSPVPIDVLSAVEIARSGGVETNELIQMLVPSFNIPRPVIGTSPASLRGLAADQVLVLVNGKRRHTNALVHVNPTLGRGSTAADMNSIPATSIERIEVLRDGAAAQYGSDAIAGVINIILKSDANTDIGLQVGSSFTKLENHPSDGYLTDGDVTSLHAAAGLKIGGDGFFRLTGQYNNRGATNRAYPDSGQYYFAGDPRNNDPAFTNRIVSKQGDATANDLGLVVNAALPTTSGGMRVYANAIGERRHAQANAGWRRPTDNNTVRSIYPDGFAPLINPTINNYSGAIGVDGSNRGWSYDLSAAYGYNDISYDLTNTLNPTLGNSSPTEFYAGKFEFGQAIVGLDLVRSFRHARLVGPVHIATGAEYRHETYGIGAGEPDSYVDGGAKVLDGPNAGAQPTPGSQGFPGFTPADASEHSRSNVAAYLDIELRPSNAFEIGTAVRGERYSDFGGTTIGKLAARYEFMPGYALRGAVSSGFRAPSLGQQFLSATFTVFQDLGAGSVPVETRTLPVESGPARALGAAPLEPERSFNTSVGLALAPAHNITVSADYYNITIVDRIVLSGNFSGSAMSAFLASQGFPNVGSARFFTNAIDTRTGGVDIVARYVMDFGSWGRSQITGGFNATKTRVTSIDPTPPALASQQAVLFSRVEQGRIERGQPSRTFMVTLDHDADPFGGLLRIKRYGSVTFFGSTVSAARDQTFTAKWIADVSASYSLRADVRLSVGANNVFDVYPDRQIPENTSGGVFKYGTTVTPFGFNGRFVYARLRYAM
jgi:iron complex outermembrane receptor protein